MYENKKILAVIPARGGSKGIPRKNIKLLAGKPLIAWTIEEAKKSKYIDTCMVSTEDEEIKQVAANFGGYVPFLRPIELAQDKTASIDTILDVIKKMPGYDYLVLLQPTSPLRTVDDIDGAIEFCIKNNAESVVSLDEVSHSPYWMYTLDEKNKMSAILEISKEKLFQRQALPKVYQINGAVYVDTINFLQKNHAFISSETFGYVMPTERSHDIDTITDFKIAEFIINERKGL